VPDNSTKLTLPPSLEGFARGLLSTTCLTVVCGSSAVAGTVTEPISAFPNSSPGYLLPIGTTVVNGFAGVKPSEGGFAGTDWFEFQGLTPGSSYTLTSVYNPLGQRGESGNGESGLTISLLTNSQSPLFTNVSMEGPGVSGVNALTGIVPSDGFLDVEIVSNQIAEQSFVEGGGSNYQVTLAAETGSASTGAPEPGTMATVGVALAGALAWNRKRRQ